MFPSPPPHMILNYILKRFQPEQYLILGKIS